MALTIIKLAISLLTVDDIKAIGHACPHVGHLKVEPLMMVVAVDVRVQDQVIFILTNLDDLPQVATLKLGVKGQG